MVTVNPIRSEADFDVAVARLGEIFFAEPGTPEGDEREVLSALVEAYDAEHYPIGPPSLAGALEFEMDQRGLTPRRSRPHLRQPRQCVRGAGGQSGPDDGNGARPAQAVGYIRRNSDSRAGS